MKFKYELAAALMFIACTPTILLGCKPGSASLLSTDHWTYEEPTDKLTGNKEFDATRTVKLDGGGTADLEAKCGSLSFAGAVGVIDASFYDADGKPINLDTNGLDAESNTGNFRYSTQAGQADTIFIKLLHTNQAEVRGFFQDSDQSKEFLDAKIANVEFPLLDGRKAVIDLLPQDQDLRKVFTQCIISHPEPVSAQPATTADSASANNGVSDGAAPARSAADQDILPPSDQPPTSLGAP